jgi:ABC-type transport system involved in multi-copper enzyme maturation permease subunit
LSGKEFLMILPVLLADLFDRLRLQLPDGIVNWLTPVWILCVGATAGLVLTAGLWGVLWLLARIPHLAVLSRPGKARRIATAVLTLLFFAAFAGLYWRATATPAAGPAGPGTAGDASRAAEVPEGPAAEPAAFAGVPGQGGAGPARSVLDVLWALGGCLVAGWLLATAVVTLVDRSALADTGLALKEGVLWPLTVTVLAMAGFSLFGLIVVRRPLELLDSLARWPVLAVTGDARFETVLDPPPSEFDEPAEVEVPVRFRKDEIRGLVVRADQHVRLRSESFTSPLDPSLVLILDVPAGETRTWRREAMGTNPFRQQTVTRLFAKNYGTGPARLEITAQQQVAHPEMLTVPVVAVSIAAVFFLYLLQRTALPKLSAVALSTAKSEMAQPLYVILMATGIFLLVVFVYIPYNTFGDDIKQLKDSGLSLILVLGVLQSVWAASSSVADEVEGKTALTVLSKPVSRRDFILGKFAGIAWAVGLMCVIFGILLLVTVAYKPIYDYREGGYEINHQPQNTDPTWHDCHREMVQTVPGIVLAYLETLVIAALSVAISTRLPALANFLISFAVYVLGHLTPLLVQSQVVAEQLPPVIFFGRLIATVLPVLDHFNIQASVAAGVPVPPTYLVWTLIYCGLYSAVAMLLALALFEDRDLA